MSALTLSVVAATLPLAATLVVASLSLAGGVAFFTLSMENRSNAVWRIIMLLWAWTIGGLIAGVIMVVGLIWGVVDILWQLILGTEGLMSDSRPAQFVSGSLHWFAEVHAYAFTGNGSVNFLPSIPG